MDDDQVVTDLADEAGAGGNTFSPFLVSSPFDGGNEGGYGRLRKFVQAVEHDGAATVTITPYRDGQETGQSIERVLATGDNPIVTAPLAAGGTRFQVKIVVSAFNALVELGKGQAWIVPRRSER